MNRRHCDSELLSLLVLLLFGFSVAMCLLYLLLITIYYAHRFADLGHFLLLPRCLAGHADLYLYRRGHPSGLADTCDLCGIVRLSFRFVSPCRCEVCEVACEVAA